MSLNRQIKRDGMCNAGSFFSKNDHSKGPDVSSSISPGRSSEGHNEN